jgi:hypothetical protein
MCVCVTALHHLTAVFGVCVCVGCSLLLLQIVDEVSEEGSEYFPFWCARRADRAASVVLVLV